MSVKLFIKDNTSGTTHEYGTNQHDALILQEDGSIHYENLQNGDGTLGGGYSFCTVSGKPPEDTEGERIVDIGGENPGVGCYKCRWKKRHQKCSCCKRNPSQKDCYEPDKKEIEKWRKEATS